MSKEFNDYSIDELEEFIKSGGEVNKEVEASEEDSEEVVEEAVEETEEVVEDKTVEATEEAVIEKEEKEDPLAKKTAEELAKIVKDQQYYEARRGEELGKLRAEVAKLKQTKAIEETAQLDETTVDNVKVVKEALKHIRKEESLIEETQTRERAQLNLSQNRSAWEELRSNEELMSLVGDALDSKFDSLGATQEDRVEQMSKNPDWVSKSVMEILSNKVLDKTRADSDATEARDAVAKRKVKASTATGGTAKTKMNKTNPDDMSFEEYEEFLKETQPGLFKG